MASNFCRIKSCEAVSCEAVRMKMAVNKYQSDVIKYLLHTLYTVPTPASSSFKFPAISPPVILCVIYILQTSHLWVRGPIRGTL